MQICLGMMHEAILKPSSKSQADYTLKIALAKIWDNFPLIQLRKLSQVFEIV